MVKQRWVDVPGYNELYLVSTTGEVMSLYNNKRTIVNGGVSKGYQFVTLTKEKTSENVYVASIMAEVFFGVETDRKINVNHKDKDRLNNVLSNLEIVSARDNAVHRDGGVIGSWHKHHKKWIANIRVNSKRVHIGYFDTKEDANKAYIKKRHELGI